jgi:hypothetical protein
MFDAGAIVGVGPLGGFSRRLRFAAAQQRRRLRACGAGGGGAWRVRWWRRHRRRTRRHRAHPGPRRGRPAAPGPTAPAGRRTRGAAHAVRARPAPGPRALRRAQVVVLPPVGQVGVDLADVGTQAQEVISRRGSAAGWPATPPNWRCGARSAAASARSRACRRQLAAAGDVADAGVEHRVDGLLQRRERRLAGLAQLRQRPCTSCHSMQASMKLGATARPSATRRSVSASARSTKLLPQRVRPLGMQHGVEDGEHARSSPCLRSSSMLRSAWPVCSSLIISSNRRDAGTLASSAHLAHRRLRGRFEREAQLGREAHHAHDAHRVFAVARGRVADHAQHPRPHVGQAAVVVDHRLRDGS